MRVLRPEIEPLLAAVAGLPDPAVLLDADGRLLAYNDRYLQMTGLRRRALEDRVRQGACALELLRRGDRDGGGGGGGGELQRCLAERQPLSLAEVGVVNEQGDAFTVALTFVPLFFGDAPPLVLQILRDFTSEARMQEQYRAMLDRERGRADELERKVRERTEDLAAALDQVTRLSRLDSLTGLLNRRAFSERAEQVLALARRYERRFGILICDLDHFKTINDTFGHQAGDTLLVAVADSLQQLFRDSDAVGRFGGEEFIVLLAEIGGGSLLEIGSRCARMVRSLPLSELIPGATGRQTASIGMATFPEHGNTLDLLVSHADQALYHAKESGRDRVVLYDSTLAATPEHVEVACRPLPRLLVLDSDSARLEGARSRLAKSYEVTCCSAADIGLRLCQRERFDALLLDSGIAQDKGAELLQQLSRLRPHLVRVLVVEDDKTYRLVSRHNPWRVHAILLREQLLEHCAAALEDALARRETGASEFAHGHVPSFVGNFDANDLERVLSQRALAFAYQPIVKASDGSLFGYEALMRAQMGGLKNPERLVEAAVRTDNIWRLGRMVREIASRPLTKLADTASLFINLHPSEVDDPLFADQTLPGIDPKRVIYEITERAPITDLQAFRRHLAPLRERGFRFAIDDLGGGYSGLNAIAVLEPDFIKLDMEIIRDIESSRRKVALVRNMVDFADGEGITVVAEGIETKEEAEVVKRLGCHLLQGYFYGRPGPPPG